MLRSRKKPVKKVQPKRAAAKSRPRLRSILSSNTIARFHEEKRQEKHMQTGRKVLLLLLLGAAGYLAFHAGLGDRIARSVKPFTERIAKAVPAKAVVKPGAGAVKKMKPAPAPAEPEVAGLVRASTGIFGLSRNRVLLPLKQTLYYDFPLITGLEERSFKAGDTLGAAGLALEVAFEAARNAPALYLRISEIAVKGPGRVELIFADAAVRAELGFRGIPDAVRNLSYLLPTLDKTAKGSVDLSYGNIAYLTEEE